jgi:polysaccharide biosynthesis/export protein
MVTTCRVITARSRIAFRRALPLMLGVALQLEMMTVPGGAQASSGSQSPSLSGAHVNSSSGKAGAQAAGPSIIPKDFSDLLIEPGDLLSVNVYDAPEFTNSYRVDQAGELTIPLCGKVALRGLTLTEAARRIEAAFKEGQILVQPQVNLDVVQYAGQFVTVAGEVGSPGRVPLIAPTKLGEILADAGGVTALAGAHIKIRHAADDNAPEEEVPYYRNQSNRETASILVRPGDSILVPRAGIVYVLGAVSRPGGYVMQEDGKLNVAQALALSGGTLLQANTGGLRVIRRNPDGTVLDFPLSYNGIAKGSQTPLQLQAQDIVYVPMSHVKSMLNSTMGIISQAAQTAIISLH